MYKIIHLYRARTEFEAEGIKAGGLHLGHVAHQAPALIHHLGRAVGRAARQAVLLHAVALRHVVRALSCMDGGQRVNDRGLTAWALEKGKERWSWAWHLNPACTEKPP